MGSSMTLSCENPRMLRVGFFPTRTRTRKKIFSQPEPDPTLTRLNPNIKNEKKFLFYPKMKSFDEEKKKSQAFFFLLQPKYFLSLLTKMDFLSFQT